MIFFAVLKSCLNKLVSLVGLLRSMRYIRKLEESVPPITPSYEAVSFSWHADEAVLLGGCGPWISVHLELLCFCCPWSTSLCHLRSVVVTV